MSNPLIQQYEDDDRMWLHRCVDDLPTRIRQRSVSQWAESTRVLLPEQTTAPGMYDFAVTPYLREIADCMSVHSPVREVDFMKASQVGATVGVLENTIGYLIDEVKDAPAIMVTADDGLVKIRADNHIEPMIVQSNLMHRMVLKNASNSQRRAITQRQMHWAGGGSLLLFGANSAAKLRSNPAMYLLLDEIDAYPERVGKEGDPVSLAQTRIKSYYERRKILRISSPVLEISSRIEPGFLRGDQRYYFAVCFKCQHQQKLEFNKVDDDGSIWGLHWEQDKENPATFAEGSVRYYCKSCGFPHENHHKMYMFDPENGAEWRATAKPLSKDRRSYHLSSLYAPLQFFTWEACVKDWLEAWDYTESVDGRVRDLEKLQEFYNNILGKTYAPPGTKVSFSSVSSHRRINVYKYGEIPNEFAIANCGSKILFLICTVDVQTDFLSVAVWGVTKNARIFVIDYWRFEPGEDDPNCLETSSPVWSRLQELIVPKIDGALYTADDGTKYNILQTFVDSRHGQDAVLAFCSQFTQDVYPIMGMGQSRNSNKPIKEFTEYTTPIGIQGFQIGVDRYKERMQMALSREWVPGQSVQMNYHFNAPADITDKQLRELMAERRVKETDINGNYRYVWKRPSGRDNELWDLLGYAYALIDMRAWQLLCVHMKQEKIDWTYYWALAEDPAYAMLFGRVN